jgi:hypothetical protein
MNAKVELKLKLHISYTGLDRTSGLQEFEAPRTSRQSAHEGGKIVSPTHRQPLPTSR